MRTFLAVGKDRDAAMRAAGKHGPVPAALVFLLKLRTGCGLGGTHSDGLRKTFLALAVRRRAAVSALPVCGFSLARRVCGTFRHSGGPALPPGVSPHASSSPGEGGRRLNRSPNKVRVSRSRRGRDVKWSHGTRCSPPAGWMGSSRRLQRFPGSYCNIHHVVLQRFMCSPDPSGPARDYRRGRF